MNKRNFIMQAAIANMLLVSAAAYAQTNLDAAAPVSTTFARELVASVATPLTLTNAAAALDITATTGYALSSGEVRYARVELDNGGTFDAATTVVALTANAGGTCTPGAVNGLGTSAIFFSITAAGTGCNALSTFLVTGARRITSTASTINASYSLYDQPSQAQAGGASGRIVNKAVVPYIKFAVSYRVVAAANAVVADVAATPSYGKFVPAAAATPIGPVTATVASLASLDYKLSAVVPKKADGLPIALSDLMAIGAAGTKLVVTGDFSAAATTGTPAAPDATKVFLATDGTCTTILASAALTATTATFNVGATATTGSSSLCYTVTGNIAIPAQTYTADLNAVSAAPATYAVTNIIGLASGAITRNGTELQAPLVQVPGGYLSRVALNNNTAVDAPYTTVIKCETGNTCTPGLAATGTIRANSQLVVDVSSIVTWSGAPRGFIVFNIAAPSSGVQGIYQIVNPGAGSLSNTVLIRPNTN